MGSLVEGFETARQRQEDRVAETHRKEEVVDHELHHLGELLSVDAQFLKDNDVAFDYSNRTLRVTHKRSPVAQIHYSAETQAYALTVMHDGTQRAPKTTEECARVLGEVLFAIMAPKQGSVRDDRIA